MKKIVIAFIFSLVATTLSQVFFYSKWFSAAFLLNPFTLIQGVVHSNDRYSFETILWLVTLNAISFILFGALLYCGEKRQILKKMAAILFVLYLSGLIGGLVWFKVLK
ncbi:MAG: hypothetical protein JEY79_02520 [Pseudodesulfovibrio sp.]|nr:hypothetical protein [Pseudodesulfovibrio sp.]